MPAQPFGFGPVLFEHPKDLLATIVGLALLLLLLYRFGLPGAKNMLVDRATKIESDTLQVDRQLENVAQLRNDYANRIAGIEQEQRERIAAAVRDADNAHADIIAEANDTARLVQRRSEEEMERERTRQRILLRQQMVQITLDAAEQAIRNQNSDQVQRSLIRNFITQVADRDNEHHPRAGGGNAPTLTPVPTPVVEPQTVGIGNQSPATNHQSPIAPAPPGAIAFGTPTPGTTTTEDTAYPNFNSFNAPDGQEEA